MTKIDSRKDFFATNYKAIFFVVLPILSVVLSAGLMLFAGYESFIKKSDTDFTRLELRGDNNASIIAILANGEDRKIEIIKEAEDIVLALYQKAQEQGYRSGEIYLHGPYLWENEEIKIMLSSRLNVGEKERLSAFVKKGKKLKYKYAERRIEDDDGYDTGEIEPLITTSYKPEGILIFINYYPNGKIHFVLISIGLYAFLLGAIYYGRKKYYERLRMQEYTAGKQSKYS